MDYYDIAILGLCVTMPARAMGCHASEGFGYHAREDYVLPCWQGPQGIIPGPCISMLAWTRKYYARSLYYNSSRGQMVSLQDLCYHASRTKRHIIPGPCLQCYPWPEGITAWPCVTMLAGTWRYHRGPCITKLAVTRRYHAQAMCYYASRDGFIIQAMARSTMAWPCVTILAETRRYHGGPLHYLASRDQKVSWQGPPCASLYASRATRWHLAQQNPELSPTIPMQRIAQKTVNPLSTQHLELSWHYTLLCQ